VPKIMIVDDEKDVVELLSFLLKKDGYEVVSAYNGREALERVEAEKPDLMLLDIMMPEVDGYTVYTKMAENEATRNIKIMILTAKGQMRDVFAMATNVAAYIEKPFDPKILREKVKKVFENK